MKSRTTARFRKAFQRLPDEVQQAARRAFRVWREDPTRPSLAFKQIQGVRLPVYSVRIGIHWRALALKQSHNEIVWFWIGSHGDYDQLLSQLS